MSIKYSFSIEQNILFVTTSGIDESLKEVMEYGQSVIKACVESNCTKVLCDERNLVYKLRPIDTFQLAEYLAENAPNIAKAAVVCNPSGISDARFWETVAVNRGLNVAVFKSLDEAEVWLDIK